MAHAIVVAARDMCLVSRYIGTCNIHIGEINFVSISIPEHNTCCESVRGRVALIANTAHHRCAPGWRVRVRGAVIACLFRNLARLHRVLPRGAERARRRSINVLVRPTYACCALAPVWTRVPGIARTVSQPTTS